MITLLYTGSDISKREDDVLYLKSKFAGYDATLLATATGLHLETENSGALRRGIYQFLPFLKDKLQIVEVVVDLRWSDIKSIAQGKQGFSSNVLEISARDGQTYRLIVKSYADWESVIKPKI